MLSLYVDSGTKKISFFIGDSRVTVGSDSCPRAPQTSPIDRKWKVELIYDGFMLRWLDRLAIGAENDRSTSGEPVEQM